ncbi:MAG TPA: hypothetical protein VGC87_09080 [Pyrinomonadaceae bacterium]|jgi:hypothetical protein
MSSIRCLNCGFLNFAADTVCKRCRAALVPPSDNPYFNSYVANMQGVYQTAPGYAQPAYSPSYFPGPVAPLPRVSKNAGTNAALLVLVGLALAVAAGIGVLWKIGNGRSANFAWQEYNSDDQTYAVELPTRPAQFVQSQPSAVGDLQVHIMLSDLNNGGAFVVMHSDYPEEFSKVPAEDLLNASAQGVTAESEATILGRKNISLDGHPGLELELSVKKLKGAGRTVTRVYWVAPRRIYVMIASIPPSSDMNAQLGRFLDSLKLRKK